MSICNDRAVSEAIGFILILALVIGSIGLVTLYGYPVLLKEQTNANIRNMERAMIVIQNDVKSLSYKNIPYKETSVQVGGGSLTSEAAGNVLPLFRIDDGNGNPPFYFYPGKMEYRSDSGDAIITLENGAVLKRYEGGQGSVMLAEPRWFYDSATKVFVIDLIRLIPSDTISQTGMGVVKIGRDQSMMNVTQYPAENSVTVTYQPDSTNDYSTAWENYLTGSLGMTKSGNDYTMTMPVSSKLVVKTYDIQVYGL